MGAHICFYVERRVGDHWEHVPGERGGEEFIFIGRGTGTFNVLAGTDVCSVSPDDGPAVDGPPKGLPGDASQVVLDAAEADESGHCFYCASWPPPPGAARSPRSRSRPW